jgi:hypothetical protein
MPSLGNGRIRIANLAVTPGNVDFCVKISSSSSWGDPIMANSGKDAFFQAGLTYPQVTVPFSAPVGTIDVRFVPIGQLCSAKPLSEGDGIVVGDAMVSGDSGASVAAPVVTILRYGGNTGSDTGIPEAVVGLPEELNGGEAACQANVCPRFRVVNAAATTDSINFGSSSAKVLPATVSGVLSNAPIAPGQATPQQPASPPLTAADASGYFGGIDSGQAGQSGMTLGIVMYPGGTPSTNAVAIFSPSSVPDTQTLYFIGDPSNDVHPLQGLLVEDDAAMAPAPIDGGADDVFLAASTPTTPPAITVDTFYAALWGETAPYDLERRQPIFDALSTHQSDVLCIGDMNFDSDKQAMVAAAVKTGNYPYAYWVHTDITTPPTNSSDWYGNTPAKVTTAACASEYANGKLADSAKCASQCSSSTADPIDGGVSSIVCLEGACTNTIVGDLAQDMVCMDCFLLYLQSFFDIDFSMQECGTDTNDPYGQYNWGGNNGELLLSAHPFATKPDGTPDVEAYIFPGTIFRRALLRAKVQINSDAKLDVYCGQFVYADKGLQVMSYDGLYATPDAGLYPTESTVDNGWRDEQSLQARDAIQWVAAQSGSNPAIIAGEWHTSPGYPPVLEAYEPEVFNQLVTASATNTSPWVPAHPTNYQQTCTYCNDNPYNAAPLTTDGTTGYDYMMTFLYNFSPNSVLSETIWDNQPGQWTIQFQGVDAGAASFPLSQFYGRSVQVLLPP